MPAGYSATPLVKKLGLKPDMRVRLVASPDHYDDLIGEWPEVVLLKTTRAPIDFAHLFVKSKAALNRSLPSLARALATDGMLWISWPKKTSTIETDLSGSAVRAAGLAAGLVDVKVCAVDDDWSGHKFVIPVKDRAPRTERKR